MASSRVGWALRLFANSPHPARWRSPPSPCGGGIRSRHASSPLFFAAWGSRPLSSPSAQAKGTERRAAQRLGSALWARARLGETRAPPGAPSRRSLTTGRAFRPLARTISKLLAGTHSGPRRSSHGRPSAKPTLGPARRAPHPVPPSNVSRRRPSVDRTEMLIILGINVKWDASSIFTVVPGEHKRDPGPILRAFSMMHNVWVPAFAGTTPKVAAHPPRSCIRWAPLVP
jgi:hypothetical protein